MEEPALSDNPETQIETRSGKTGFIAEQIKRHGGSPRATRVVASQLRPGDVNTRFWYSTENRAEVIAKARSIAKHTVLDGGKLVKSGVIEPIRAVNVGGTEPAPLVAGETRWRGVRLLEGFDVLTGKPAVPGVGVLADVSSPMPSFPVDLITFDVFFADKSATITDLRVAAVMSNDQHPFTDLEWALQIKAFMTGDPENGVKAMPQNEIAEALGRDPGWVSHINKLNSAPAELLPYLVEGQIKTTTIIEQIELFGPEEAARLILAEIEEGKGRAAEEYEEAMVEARTAQAHFERIMSSPERDEPANPTATGPRRITKGESARRAVTTATTKAERANRERQRGPDRVTSRAVKERKARETVAETGDAGDVVAVNRVNVKALVEAVVFAAKRSKEPFVREQMNDALKRVGHPAVAAMVDDDGNELPLPDETASEAANESVAPAVETEAATA